VLDRIEALRHCGFGYYEGPISVTIEHRLPIWLEQFTNEEQKIAFILASRILFVTRPMLRSLQRHVYERKIRRLLLDDIIREQALPPFRYDLASPHLSGMLERSLFVELTASADIKSFTHVNTDLNRPSSRNLIGPRVETLVEPAKIVEHDDRDRDLAEGYRDNLVRRRLSGKTHLFILEDISGSGQTAANDIRRILTLYPEFRRVVFCPYISTQAARGTVTATTEADGATSRRVAVLEGLELPTEAKAFHADCYLWQDYDLPLPAEEIRNRLHRICEEYWNSHHHSENNPYAATSEPERIGPGGYRDTQLLLVLYSNCPNNSLPIIWSAADGVPQAWQPLFARYPNY
jgi:hypothetical protein